MTHCYKSDERRIVIDVIDNESWKTARTCYDVRQRINDEGEDVSKSNENQSRHAADRAFKKPLEAAQSAVMCPPLRRVNKFESFQLYRLMSRSDRCSNSDHEGHVTVIVHRGTIEKEAIEWTARQFES